MYWEYVPGCWQQRGLQGWPQWEEARGYHISNTANSRQFWVATQQSLQDQGHQPTCMKTCFKKFRKHQFERGIWEQKEWETADRTSRWEVREVPGTAADIHIAACEGPHNGVDGYWQRSYSLWRTYTWAEQMCEEEGVAIETGVCWPKPSQSYIPYTACDWE